MAAALPFCLSASTVTVDFNISLNGIDGTGQASYDPSQVAGGGNPYADPNDGLTSFDLSYNGTTYSNTSSNLLDSATLPTVFLPGNETLQHGLSYEFFSFWVVDGSCSGSITSNVYNGTCSGPDNGGADLLALGRSTEVALIDDVTSVTISFTGNSLTYNLGYGPDITEIAGTITSESVVPEPRLLPLSALCLAGLWWMRRRRAAIQ